MVLLGLWAMAAILAQAHADTWPMCRAHTSLGVPVPALNDDVTELKLSYCYLKNIKRKVFDVYPNLQILDLSHNKIPMIYKDWFGAALENLDLSYNSIAGEHVNSRVFENASNLMTIRFDGNNMSGAPSDLLKGTRVSSLYLSHCQLREVPEMARTPELNIELLVLASNRISRLDDSDTFTSLTRLLVLHLENNTIACLDKDVFKPLTQLVEIHLANNNIRHLPDGIFRSLNSLSTIDLSCNFIEYVPANAFHVSNVMTLNISENRITYLPVNFFTYFTNSGYLQVLFRNNPWQCACLNEVLIEAKRLYVVYDCETSYSNDCVNYNGKEPLCVTNDFKCHRQNEVFKFYDNNIREINFR